MITIYSRETCPYCIKAKALLDKYDIKYESVDIDKNAEAKTFLLHHNHRSVPQLFVNDDLFVVGGYSGLATLTREEIINRLGELNAKK